MTESLLVQRHVDGRHHVVTVMVLGNLVYREGRIFEGVGRKDHENDKGAEASVTRASSVRHGYELFTKHQEESAI